MKIKSFWVEFERKKDDSVFLEIMEPANYKLKLEKRAK